MSWKTCDCGRIEALRAKVVGLLWDVGLMIGYRLLLLNLDTWLLFLTGMIGCCSGYALVKLLAFALV